MLNISEYKQALVSCEVTNSCALNLPSLKKKMILSLMREISFAKVLTIFRSNYVHNIHVSLNHTSSFI